MKLRLIQILCSIAFVAGCSTSNQALSITDCTEHGMSDSAYSRSVDVQLALEELVSSGVPGASIAVYSETEGWWVSSAGYAQIEDEVPMRTCHLQYLQSISKTYMAVAVLKLYEHGGIQLDNPITDYLPVAYSRHISDAERITVRMLLNHTSGIPEYNFSAEYVTYLLQHPDYEFTPSEYLGYIDGKPLDFVPGSRYSYRNTNYLVLALITDAITGDHAEYIEKNLLEPLGLTHTYYRGDSGYLNYPLLANSYWDRYSNGIVENVSKLQRNNVASLIGDDGIVTTPIEAVIFLRSLLEGKLLSGSTLEEMKTWVRDSSDKPRYGLGLGHAEFQGEIGIGHSGGGIGAGAELRYFPDKDLYVFVGINLGTVTGSPLHVKAEKARNKLFDALLK